MVSAKPQGAVDEQKLDWRGNIYGHVLTWRNMDKISWVARS